MLKYNISFWAILLIQGLFQRKIIGSVLKHC
jgi:hypothetical protein